MQRIIRNTRGRAFPQAIACATLLMSISSVSHAELLTLGPTGWLAVGTQSVAAGGAVSGQFKTPDTTWHVNSGTITASFSDAWFSDGWTMSDPQLGQYQFIPGESCRIMGGNSCTLDYQRDSTTTFSIPSEIASLTVAGTTVQASSPHQELIQVTGSNTTTTSSQRTLAGDYCSEGEASCIFTSISRWTTRDVIVTSGNWGNFSLSMTLNQAALADINADGMLGFNIASVFGDFDLESVFLKADAEWVPLVVTLPDDPIIVIIPINEQPPIVIPPTNNVPEPGSLALLGLGLAGLSAIRRKHKAS